MSTATLTPEQVEKLNLAVERARAPGLCRYIAGNEPCCVVAQLAALEGAAVDDMRPWEGESATSIYEFAPLLHGYPKSLLGTLQRIWDDGESNGLREDEIRDAMRAAITKAAAA